MKKISISKGSWRHLCQIKNEQHLTNFSQTINYLINGMPCLHQENLREIHEHVDMLKPAKNLGENVAKHESLVIEFQCLQCDNAPFTLNVSDCNDAGIMCPFCGYQHSIAMFFEENENKKEV